MKFIKIFVMLLVCSMVFMGCPYSAEIALDAEPAVKIDNRLIGTYQKSDTKYIVTKSSDLLYKIVEKSEEEETNYMGFLSKIGEATFLNIYEANASNRQYYFYKVEIVEGGNVELHPLTTNIKETFTTSAELKSFVTKYKDLSFFYDMTETYVKE
ncbi:MAG TPA: hypothetical protein VEC12_14755 [Bacteroidia bacterium]|nr:hypothetical protein [Bacteroidia bacterium]